MPYREVYLTLVSEENNNKYYHMVQENEADSTFVSTYGRVNKTAATETYSIDKWDKKFKEKVKKGYTDLTQMRATSHASTSFKDLSASVAGLITKLQNYSNNSVKQNYTISIGAVTKMQLEAAQEALNNALNAFIHIRDHSYTAPIHQIPDSHEKDINQHLIKLYTVLPRQMSDTRNYLVNDRHRIVDWVEKLLSNEQDILDSLATQVNIHNVDDKDQQTILEALGLQVEAVTDQKQIDVIKGLMTDSAHQFSKAYLVTNLKTQNAYDMKYPKLEVDLGLRPERMLFHASRNANWLSILQNGLLIRPSGAVYSGSMFGDGIYFADRAKKSIGYSSLSGSYWANGNSNEGYLALYSVYLGKSFHCNSNNSRYQYLNKMNYKDMKAMGYDSVFAEQSPGFLHNNEYIIYQPQQCTIEFLIEIK